jgi:hypothetical protein
VNGSEAPDAPKLGAVIVRAGSAVLQIGADAARIVAEAASGRPQPVRQGEAPLVSMLRYGGTAAGSLVGLAFNAVRGRNAPAPAPSPRQPAAAAPPAREGPRLRPGGSARIPLSIDNPGTEPMVGLVPRVTGATRDGVSAEPAFVMRFVPETLTVAPRDFEKLVVMLELAGDIKEGEWSAFFTLSPDGSDPHELPFQVTGGS